MKGAFSQRGEFGGNIAKESSLEESKSVELWWLLIGWVVAGPEKNVLLLAGVYRVRCS